MMDFYGKTHTGKVRPTNQDTFYIDAENNWAVVADGMGGHLGGETASSLTVDVIKESMAVKRDLKQAIKKANDAVYKKSIEDSSLSGMGTTVVLCKVDESNVTIAHVGDSRAYLVTDDGIKQITQDHSIVQQLIESGTITKEQAKYHPQRNLITRAVGTEKYIDVDVNKFKISQGEIILICSDGLCSYVDDNKMYEILKNYSTEESVNKLIDAANEAGGKDNITVVLIKA